MSDSTARDASASTPPAGAPPERVGWSEAFWVWCEVAALSFGGPAAQISVMHRILVDERRWISEARFLHALNYCMLLPGPEAQQLATYIGWLLHGVWGGLMAGLLFILPGIVSLLALSLLYVYGGETSLVQGLLLGLKAAVLAIVAEALLRVGRRVLRGAIYVALAAAAFVAIFLFAVPFPLVLLAAAGAGLLGGWLRPEWFPVDAAHGPAAASAAADLPPPELFPADISAADDDRRPTLVGSLATLVLCLALWFAPLGALAAWLGTGHVLVHEGLYFSFVAIVTFGGAYAVLGYVSQTVVATLGWLRPEEMTIGLSFAETTPGPLIMVVQFVGFLAAWRHPEPLDPLPAALLGSAIVTWVTFVPCFLWIFLGAPYIERLRESPALGAPMAAITAAVVGVIFHLALWMAIHTLFAKVDEGHFAGLRLYVPHGDSLQFPILLLGILAAVLLFATRFGLLGTLGVSAALGLAWKFLVP